MIIDDMVKKYYEMAESFELLSAQKEEELAFIIKQYKGCKRGQLAREELANHNLQLVIKIAYEFYNNENNYIMGRDRSELTLMDLINAGNVGLMKAVDLYNPKKYHTRFSTYAWRWIKQGMLTLVIGYNCPVHVPINIVSNFRKYNKINKNEISDKNIMKDLRITERGLQKIKRSKVTSHSMDVFVEQENSDSYKTVKDFIPDTKIKNPCEETIKKDDSKVIMGIVEKLDPVSRRIIYGQYLAPNKIKLKTLGERYKITGERVRQIGEKALRKIRKEFKKKKITQY